MDCTEDISKLGLKTLTCNALKRNGINTLADLLASNPEQIMSFHLIGQQGLTDIYFSLKNNIGIVLSDYEEYIRTDDSNNFQGCASGYKTFHNLEGAKDHFWKRYQEMAKSYPFDIWSRFGIASVDWDTIRRFTCHIFGVSVIKDISDNNLEKANELAISFIDQMFDMNELVLKEKVSDNKDEDFDLCDPFCKRRRTK